MMGERDFLKTRAVKGERSRRRQIPTARGGKRNLPLGGGRCLPKDEQRGAVVRKAARAGFRGKTLSSSTENR